MPKKFIFEEKFFYGISLDNVNIKLHEDKYLKDLEKLKTDYNHYYEFNDVISVRFKDNETAKAFYFLINNISINIWNPLSEFEDFWLSRNIKIELNPVDNSLKTKGKMILFSSRYFKDETIEMLEKLPSNLTEWIKFKFDLHYDKLKYIYTSEIISETLGIKIKGASIYIPQYNDYRLLMYTDKKPFIKKLPGLYNLLKYSNPHTENFFVPKDNEILWDSLHKSLKACLNTHRKIYNKYKEYLKSVENISKLNYNYV